MNKHRLKFLMITTFYPPYNFGGDGIWVQRLSHSLAKLGHQVDVVHSVDAYNILGSSTIPPAKTVHPNINVYSFRNSLQGLSSLLTQQTGRSLLKRQVLKSMIIENKYDVIAYHNMSLIGLEALSWGNAVKLYTAHEYWLICPMHVLWRNNREACEKPTCISCQIRGGRPPQLWRYSDYMQKQIAHIDAIISPSQFLINKYQAGGIRASYKCLPFFIPAPDVSSSVKAPPKTPYFLYVGRLEKIKGLQNIIPIFRNYPRAELIIAGEGNYMKQLQKTAAGAANIKFLGKQSYSELQHLYKHARALIMPSICYETFGLVILEAFSQGTPVIVNNIGGMPEPVTQSGGGFVYDHPGEIPELLDRFLDTPQIRQEMGENGYRAYLTNWSESTYLEKYFTLIREIALRRKIETPAIAATAHG